MKLSAPAGRWLSILAMPIAYPTSPASSGAIVSNDPYRLGERQTVGLIRLERNAHYWSASTVAIDAVEYCPVVDEMAELNRYRRRLASTTSLSTLPSRH